MTSLSLLQLQAKRVMTDDLSHAVFSGFPNIVSFLTESSVTNEFQQITSTVQFMYPVHAIFFLYYSVPKRMTF